jgi:hypothetical protein
MTSKSKHLTWLTALAVAILFDQLIWEKPAGINILIIVILALVAGGLPFWMDKINIPITSYLLLIPILTFTTLTVFRSEPYTNLINGAVMLFSLILLVIALRNGLWPKFRLRTHVEQFIKFLLFELPGGLFFFIKTRGTDQDKVVVEASEAGETPDETPVNPGKKQPFRSQLNPYLRGLALALPIIILLAALLAAADPIFEDRLLGFLGGFSFENLGETLFRIFYILILAYILLGAVYFALVESKKITRTTLEEGDPKPFLGNIEATIVLVAVNLLFLVFVILQLNYLFGGGENISAAGYTYAEYARRGFFELLAVALISLGLFYALSLFTKRESKAQRLRFSVLGLLLVALVGIILASAYTRLRLYELAYGFTTLRTLAHIAMIFVGLLLAVAAVLEITQRMDRAAFALIIALFAFGLTVNLLNVDAFIVRQNVARILNPTPETADTPLDTGYLFTLSYDAIPPLVDTYTNPQTPNALRDDLGGVLACRLATMDEDREAPWTSYHHARTRGKNILQSLSDDLADYPTFFNDGGVFVEVNGEMRNCYGYPDTYDMPID